MTYKYTVGLFKVVDVHAAKSIVINCKTEIFADNKWCILLIPFGATCCVRREN